MWRQHFFYCGYSRLTRPLIKTAVKALATAGLSVLSRENAQENLRQRLRGKWNQALQTYLSDDTRQKRPLKTFFVGQGIVCGGGTAKYGECLGMLTSIGVPITIDLISKMIGKGLLVRQPPLKRRWLPPPRSGKRMPINLPGAFLRQLGWSYKKQQQQLKFNDVPLSNFDLKKTAADISTSPSKEYFRATRRKPLLHSPCILNMNDLEAWAPAGLVASKWVGTGTKKVREEELYSLWHSATVGWESKSGIL